MNRDQFQGKWTEIKGKVKRKWGKLTDDDVAQINGNHEELAGRLQKNYGHSKEEAKRQVDAFIDSL